MKRHHRQTWPRLLRSSQETACHFCDTLYQVQRLKEGEKAHCQTCGKLLYRNRTRSLERTVALALSGVFLFGLFIFLPFIKLYAQGNVIEMNVLEAIRHMWLTKGYFIAISVSLFVIILPFAQLVSLLYVCLPLLIGRSLPGVIPCTKALHNIQPWVMTEVFFFGIIVSMIKLVKLADVQLLTGFWSLIAVMFCLIGAYSSIDKLELWDRIEVSLLKLKNQLIS